MSGIVTEGTLQAELEKKNMEDFYGLLHVLMLSAIMNSNGITMSQRTSTNVVSQTFCDSTLPAEENMSKKTLKEIHTYAELKHDPRASLPDSFTICSSIMTPSCPNYIWPAFFTILDNEGAQFLATICNRGFIESSLEILYHLGATELITGKIPPLFPNQWIKSCLALNISSGLIHWVVEGTLIMTTTSEEVKNSKNKPKDLSNKVVLGARSYGGIWFQPSQKVTNLNIYSSSLSIERMKSMTKEESCIEEGDYLAWEDMEWILHGQATIESMDKEEPCKGEPYVDLYYTRFPGWDSCMHHCQNLGTRVPSVNTFQDWDTLQRSMKMDLYDKDLNTLELWLPINDKEAEGEWRDFYTKDIMGNFTLGGIQT